MEPELSFMDRSSLCRAYFATHKYEPLDRNLRLFSARARFSQRLEGKDTHCAGHFQLVRNEDCADNTVALVRSTTSAMRMDDLGRCVRRNWLNEAILLAGSTN